MVTECGEVGQEGLLEGGAVGAERHDLLGWEGVECDLDFVDKGQGTLAASEKFAEVDGRQGMAVRRGTIVEADGFVDGIAAAAAAQGGVGEVVEDELTSGFVVLPALELAVDELKELAAITGAGGEFRAVGEKAFDFEDVVASATVDERVGAAGVVAEHAADAASVAGGGLGAEKEAVGFEGEVEFVANHAGLDPRPTLGGIYFENVVEVTADIDDDAAADDLAGDGGATGARDEGGVVFMRIANEFGDVILFLGEGHAQGQLAVGTCIGGVGYAVEAVGENRGHRFLISRIPGLLDF